MQRLTVLAVDNLEREAVGDEWRDAGASPKAGVRGGDVHLHTADAELDFQETATEPGMLCCTMHDACTCPQEPACMLLPLAAAEAFAKATCHCSKRALRNMAVRAGRPGCVGSHVVHRDGSA